MCGNDAVTDGRMLKAGLRPRPRLRLRLRTEMEPELELELGFCPAAGADTLRAATSFAYSDSFYIPC